MENESVVQQNHPVKKATFGQFRRDALIFVWTGLALPLASWILFYWYVNFQSILMAFQDMKTGEWSLVNFKDIWIDIVNPINERDSLARAFKNTMTWFSVSLFICYPIQVITPYFLYKRVPCHKVLRFLLMLPGMIPQVAMANIFKIIIQPEGILAYLFNIDIPPQGWLNMESTATTAMIANSIWTCPCGYLMLLGGMMARLPMEVLESAKLDGIGPVKELIFMIIPLIWSTFSIYVIMFFCGFLWAGGPVLLLSPNSYDTGSTTIAYWINSKVYNFGRTSGAAYNLASAAGLLLTLIVWPTSMLIRKLFSLIPSVEY